MNKPFLRPESGRLCAARAAFLRRAARIVQFGIAATCVALPLAASLLAFAPAAYAERADNDKPLNIEADNMTYDDLKQVNIFTGHVVATKGTIIIKADRVDVTQDPQGYQYATGTSTGGNLSYFRQKRDGLDEYIEGNAVRIDYDGKQDLFGNSIFHLSVSRAQFELGVTWAIVVALLGGLLPSIRAARRPVVEALRAT